MKTSAIVVFVVFLVCNGELRAAELFDGQPHVTRWITAENPTGSPGQGGLTNRGAKGRPYVALPKGVTITIADIQGSGIVRKIWMTLDDLSPRVLRSIKIEMFWDGASRPAVSVPLVDFFGMPLARMVAFESELFASPEGRSFNSYVPMPFKRSARITLTNEGERTVGAVFYEVDYELGVQHKDSMYYFHAYWHRAPRTVVGQDHELLPKVTGKGRYLASSIGVATSRDYFDTGWQEGEFKAYLDGDGAHPTLVGTGTEDYIGSGWGQKKYAQRFLGSIIADPENHLWAFYRQHVPDPIWFAKDARITLQQMGGAPGDDFVRIKKSGVPIEPVGISTDHFVGLYDEKLPASIEDYVRGKRSWVAFYRSDDVTSVAYFYLDRPMNELPPLAKVADRILDIPDQSP